MTASAPPTVTKYAIQHRTSRRYVAAHPKLRVHIEHDDVDHAVGFDFQSIAELYRDRMGSFAGAWDVVPILRPAGSPEASV